MAYLPKPKKSNKRTSLMPTWMNKKKRYNNNQDEEQPKLENNVPDNKNSENSSVEFVNNSQPYEKVTLRNTTTRSVERVESDGSYTSAVETKEEVEEKIKYGKTESSFEDRNIIDLYPVEDEYFEPNKEITSPSSTNLLTNSVDSSSSTNILNMVRQNGLLLKNIKNQTQGLCLEAVKQNGLALQYAEFQNEMICLAAINENIDAFKYIKNRSPKLNLRAIQIDPLLIKKINIHEQTEEVSLAAVSKNPLCLKYIKTQTDKVCLTAVKHNWISFSYVRNKNEMLCNEVVKINGLALEFIKNQTPEICLNAVIQNPFSLEFVINQTPEICEEAIFKNGLALEFVNKKTRDLCLLALQQNSQSIKYFPNSLLSGSIDFSDYVFVSTGTKSIIPSITKIRGLKRINLPNNDIGYNIINALMYNETSVNFVIEKQGYLDDELIRDLKNHDHFVVVID